MMLLGVEVSFRVSIQFEKMRFRFPYEKRKERIRTEVDCSMSQFKGILENQTLKAVSWSSLVRIIHRSR
jgi:hypothetical protein